VTIEEQVVAKLRALPPHRQHEVLAFVESLAPKKRAPKRRNFRGLWKGQVNISAEEIAEARREMWGNFPRDDI
jgi:hypothetical protein